MQTQPTNVPTNELPPQQQAAMIAEQNDAFRKAIGRPGIPAMPQGTVVMTRSISERSDEFRSALLTSVRDFDVFDYDCDPHGWHEMGAIEIEGEKIWFKIDLYDEDYQMGSTVPEDPERTRRVLTLMFPDEY